MKYQLGKVLASIVLCVVWLTATTHAMGETLNRQDPGAVSLSHSLPEASALYTDEQKRRVSDARARQTEPGRIDTNGPVENQDGQPKSKKPGTMVLSKFNVEGNTILSQAKIDATLDKYKGVAVQFK